MSTETPIYEELKDKWTDENYQRAICDQYWTVTHTATGQEWFEDDEGNEVFPEPEEENTAITYFVGRPDTAKGYEELSTDPEYLREASIRREGRKNRFKLFGRNQGTNGTL